jgi:hypothetical protein
MTEKLSRKEQWTLNSQARRQAIKDAGGRQVLVMVSPEDNKMLDAILAHRKDAAGKRISLTAWLSKVIRADFLAIKRGQVRQRVKPAGKAGARTSERT